MSYRFALPAALVLLGTLIWACPSQSQQSPKALSKLTPVVLDPSQGLETGSQYEAFMSPYQEPAEERDMPAGIPKQFHATAPAQDRHLRPARGHGVLRFSKDLSRVIVDVKVDNLKAEDVVMFHIHCGKPDLLGPILVDLGDAASLQQDLRDGVMSVEITHLDIEAVLKHSHGLVGAFTAGCPVVPDQPLLGKVKTIAGMEHIARQSELYFNLHTKGQTFYGDIRGQIWPVKP